MIPTTLPTAQRRQGLQGRHVASIFFAFFAAVFAMNGAMIYSAISTYSGIVSNEPYRKGLHYNERISAGERQARLGWTDTVAVSHDGHIVVTLADGNGSPVIGTSISARLGRPSSNRHDIQFDLVESAPGRYEAQAGRIDDGNWIIALEIRRDANSADPDYRARRRLWLTP
jgi:nitrogen fixation protein FixH